MYRRRNSQAARRWSAAANCRVRALSCAAGVSARTRCLSPGSAGEPFPKPRAASMLLAGVPLRPTLCRQAAAISELREPPDFGRFRAAVEIPLRSPAVGRSEEHTSELQSPCNLVCRLLLEKK